MAFEALQLLVDSMAIGTWEQIPNTNAELAGEEGRGGLRTKAEIDNIQGGSSYPGANMWGQSGSKSIFSAESGAAFDGKKMYFTGGGHFDYGGNEIYAFDFSVSDLSLGWERITEPSPLTVPFPNIEGDIPDYCRMAEDGPEPSHTWNMFTYNPINNSLVHSAGDTNGFCVAPEGSGLVNYYHPLTGKGLMWEYKLDTSEWVSYQGNDSNDSNNDYGTAIWYPPLNQVLHWNKRTWGSNRLGPWAFDINGYLIRRGTTNPLDGRPFAMVYNPTDGLIYQTDGRDNVIKSWDASSSILTRETINLLVVPDKLLEQNPLDTYRWSEGGWAINVANQTILLWTGVRQTWLYDIAKNTITEHANVDSVKFPTSHQRHIYTKFAYIPEVNAYVGMMIGTEDLWVYKLDDESGGVVNRSIGMRTKNDVGGILIGKKTDLQNLINSPPVIYPQSYTYTGSVATIPAPGLLTNAVINGTVSEIIVENNYSGWITNIQLDGSFSVNVTDDLPQTLITNFIVTDEFGVSNTALLEIILSVIPWTSTKLIKINEIIIDRVIVTND